MVNVLLPQAGGPPEGYDVTSAGVRVAVADKFRNYWACTNASDEPIYLALMPSPDGTTSPAEVGKGIYLGPAGGSFELNNVNMYRGEIWAIHAGSGSKRLCVQASR